MEMQRKQLIIFIPFEYRSYGEIAKDCVANGRKLFAEIKNSFEYLGCFIHSTMSPAFIFIFSPLLFFFNIRNLYEI